LIKSVPETRKEQIIEKAEQEYYDIITGQNQLKDEAKSDLNH
jgi:hypothetical protein